MNTPKSPSPAPLDNNRAEPPKSDRFAVVVTGLVSLAVAALGTLGTIYASGNEIRKNEKNLAQISDNLEKFEKRLGDANGELDRIDRTLRDVLPVGTVVLYAGVIDEDNREELKKNGWLLCLGQVVNSSDYPQLHHAIAKTYGSDNGEGDFRLPDLRGRTPVGVGKGEDLKLEWTLGKMDGNESHTLTLRELPTHSHSYEDSRYFDEPLKGQSGYDPLRATKKGDDNGGLETRRLNTESSGQSQGFSLVQPSIGLHFIIKAK